MDTCIYECACALAGAHGITCNQMSIYNLRTYLFSLHFDNSPLHPFPHPIELPLLPIFMSFYLFVAQST